MASPFHNADLHPPTYTTADSDALSVCSDSYSTEDSDSYMSDASTRASSTYTFDPSANRRDAATQSRDRIVDRDDFDDSTPHDTPPPHHQPQRPPKNEPTTSANVYGAPQPARGPIRNASAHVRRFVPYEPTVARAPRRPEVEAGPSILPPRAPPVGQSTVKRRSRKTTDAETTINTEEGEAPIPKRIRVPNGQGRLRKHRIHHQDGSGRLIQWAADQGTFKSTPSFNEALAAALLLIETKRDPVYDEPRLFGHKPDGVTPALGSGKVDKERRRRQEETRLYLTLSRYYELKKGVWRRYVLLAQLLNDLENNPGLR